MPLIELHSASLFLDNAPILHDLTWRLERGAHFAILGGNGAGKSTFLRLIAGLIWPRPHDSRFYHFAGARTWSPLRARPQIALLSPEIQERFARQTRDGIDGERGWQIDARTAVTAGLFGSELLHQTPSATQKQRVESVLEELEIADLAQRPLQTLSQGQLRRVLLARALVSRPKLLLLDEACSGLDAASRAEMLETIENLAQSGQTTIGITTHRQSEIVASIRGVFTLENGRFIEKSPAPRREKTAVVALAPPGQNSELIRLENAAVFLDGAPVLRDLNWRMRRGQHFALEGKNGSGKTTFLRLLRGELFPARGGKIVRFGVDKLQSRAAIGRHIALLSPALQAIYGDAISVETAVASGFFDSFGVLSEISPAQREKVARILEICTLSDFSKRSFARLSYGERRRVLLARALVGAPQILLLDEALDGLDASSRQQFHAILARVAAHGTHLIVTSHHEADYPPFLTHRLRLEAGEIAACEAF